jgi:hypothetical protein
MRLSKSTVSRVLQSRRRETAEKPDPETIGFLTESEFDAESLHGQGCSSLEAYERVNGRL